MNQIPFTPVSTFSNGRKVGLTNEPGTVPFRVKDGEIDLAYGAGAVVLADSNGKSIAGPVDMNVGLKIATDVVEGDARTITDPLAIYLIAASLLMAASSLTPAHAGLPGAD